jgi:hypothetical protein
VQENLSLAAYSASRYSIDGEGFSACGLSPSARYRLLTSCATVHQEDLNAWIGHPVSDLEAKSARLPNLECEIQI